MSPGAITSSQPAAEGFFADASWRKLGCSRGNSRAGAGIVLDRGSHGRPFRGRRGRCSPACSSPAEAGRSGRSAAEPPDEGGRKGGRCRHGATLPMNGDRLRGHGRFHSQAAPRTPESRRGRRRTRRVRMHSEKAYRPRARGRLRRGEGYPESRLQNDHLGSKTLMIRRGHAPSASRWRAG